MKKQLISLMLAALMLLSLSACGRSAEKTIKDMELGSGKAELREETQDESGRVIQHFSDDCYDYSLYEDTGELISCSLNNGGYMQLDSDIKERPEEAVDIDGAYEILNNVLDSCFPEYDKGKLDVQLQSESTGYIESYRFSIQQIEDDALINSAGISLAFNGKPAYISGSHNEDGSAFEDYKIQKSELETLLPEYLKSTGVEAGFQELLNYSALRVIHEGRLCWRAYFEIYGAELPVAYMVYLDADTGEVLSCETAQ